MKEKPDEEDEGDWNSEGRVGRRKILEKELQTGAWGPLTAVM